MRKSHVTLVRQRRVVVSVVHLTSAHVVKCVPRVAANALTMTVAYVSKRLAVAVVQLESALVERHVREVTANALVMTVESVRW